MVKTNLQLKNITTYRPFKNGLRTGKDLFLLRNLQRSIRNQNRTLSIDIDIILKKQSDIELTFNSFIAEKGFTRVELQHRDSGSQIEKTHYKFFYEPVHNIGLAQDYVLLDILFEEPHYINIVKQLVSSSFCLQEGDPVSVSVPSYEDILGDKLTAFAPNTTGIPYKKMALAEPWKS